MSERFVPCIVGTMAIVHAGMRELRRNPAQINWGWFATLPTDSTFPLAAAAQQLQQQCIQDTSAFAAGSLSCPPSANAA